MNKVVRPDNIPAKDEEKKVTRKQFHLRVPVLPEERAAIEHNAKQAGLSVAAYLRNVGLGYRITGITDSKQVEELIRINGDLGRLGGLLKMWLANDERAKRFGKSHIQNILDRVLVTQNEMYNTIKLIVRPLTKSKP
jgi:hypothetical protein